MSSPWTVSGTLHEIRLGGRANRVFRVRWSSPRAVLAGAHRGRAYDMYVDRMASRDLLAAWCLAARSRHSLVWLPMRANIPPTVRVADEGDRPLDLVLLHGDLQFPVHDWKRLRSALGRGRPMTAKVPRHEFPDAAEVRRAPAWRRHLDSSLRFDEAAETMFVVGTRAAFGIAGALLAELAAEAATWAARKPRCHYCAEIDRDRVWREAFHRRVGPGTLHVVYVPEWTNP